MFAASRPLMTVTQDDELFRSRLARFGIACGTLGFLALAVRLLGYFVFDRPFASYVWHAATATTMLATAPLSRWIAKSRGMLDVIDAVMLPLGALGYGAMGLALGATEAAPSLVALLVVILAVSYCAFARAFYMPSSGRRTFLITTACLPGILLSCGNVTRDARLGLILVASSLTWWTITTITATLASNVVYGLEEKVRAVRRYGQYSLEEKLGEGGMGVVYRASHAMLKRPTALKLLPPSREVGSAIARFEREVRLTARLKHPHTVTIFDYGRTPDGVFYYAMELIDGETLEDIVSATGPICASRVVRLARQVAGALAEAHELGLVHRDVKPANIMLCASIGGENDIAKVLDFGLVRDQNAELGATATGGLGFVGTPLYMSPEAITDPTSVTGASDLYALGAVLYFVLTGTPVFDDTSAIEMCASHIHQAPVPPSCRTPNAIPAELETLVLSCLAKTPTERPRSARDLARQLARLEQTLAATAWEPEAVAAWWTEHAEAIAQHRKRRTPRSLSSASSRLLAVDFLRG